MVLGRKGALVDRTVEEETVEEMELALLRRGKW